VQENEEGRPFVGNSGFLLNQLLVAVSRSDEVREYQQRSPDLAAVRNKLYEHERIYLTNAILCGNGHDKPKRQSLACCQPRLLQEVYSADPRIIVAMGAHAASALLGQEVKITEARGKVFPLTVKGVLRDSISYSVLCTYHPSMLLRSKDQASIVGGVWSQMLNDLASAFYLVDAYRHALTGEPLPTRGK